MRYNSVMYKVNNGTRLFIRFLREKGIKYIYIEETLLDTHKNNIINNDMDGNLLRYFNKLISRGFYDVIGRSFIWDYTKKGYDFWRKMNDMWFDYYFKKA